MAKAIGALDYLGQADQPSVPPVCVVYGDESFLKRQVLLRLREGVVGSDEGDFSLATFDGEKTAMKDVLGELSTMAMFGGGKRFVVVEQSDNFISRYRQNLEDYVSRPASTGVLALVADSFPGNTRLYKAAAANGLVIDCSTPDKASLLKWIVEWGRKVHDLRVSQASAGLLVELVGPELGLLDQELAKLANVADKDRKVTEEMISQTAGGWRARTTWDMLDAALEGKVAAALEQLDRLLLAGETPVGLLAQISSSLRRLAAATRLVIQAEAARQRINLRGALKDIGVNAYFLEKTERQLRRLGRQRGSQLYQWLLDADLDLKGDSSFPPRLVLERLIVRVASGG
jgi:DNA polymerase-3 subunit delta